MQHRTLLVLVLVLVRVLVLVLQSGLESGLEWEYMWKLNPSIRCASGGFKPEKISRP